jgi:hypothetical protein
MGGASYTKCESGLLKEVQERIRKNTARTRRLDRSIEYWKPVHRIKRHSLQKKCLRQSNDAGMHDVENAQASNGFYCPRWNVSIRQRQCDILLGSRRRPLPNIWRASCSKKQDILDSSKAIDFDCRGTDPELGIQITLDLESTP